MQLQSIQQGKQMTTGEEEGSTDNGKGVSDDIETNFHTSAGVEDRDGSFISELQNIKSQMESLKNQLQAMAVGTTPATPPNPVAGRREVTQQMLNPDDFPAIGNQAAANSTPLLGGNTVQTLWKDKVSKPTAHSIRMPLKFVPPSLENGKPIVHIET